VGAHPFQFTLPHDVERIVTGLRSYDRDAWAAAFSAAAGCQLALRALRDA
jgi:hypothetical protein